VSISSANQSGEWSERALAYYRAGNYARARDCTQEALASDPGNVACLLLKGMALIELGEPEDAVGPLQQATSIAPDSADAWRQLGIAFLTAGERADALQAFKKALVLRPGDVPLLIDVGNLLFMLAKPQDALDTLEQARRLVPGDLAVLRNLAEMQASLNSYEDALKTTLEILELRPDDVLACCDAASFSLHLDRLDEAAEIFRTLRRIDAAPEHEVYAIHGLVMTEIRRGDWRRAIDLVIEATRMDRYDLTTSFLIYISGKLFGKRAVAEIPLDELVGRFDAQQREHRRLHAEVQA
jgi:tetratricopeptide (TPR) repeat protein